jgi:hypothetical protein
MFLQILEFHSFFLSVIGSAENKKAGPPVLLGADRPTWQPVALTW